MDKIKISVRSLVEFILRSGDIDEGERRVDTLKAMQEGQRIHKKIQKSYSASYRAEVPLSFENEFDDYCLLVQGRADGIFYDSVLFVDEIKGMYTDVKKLKEPLPVHLAQAKVYAAIIFLTGYEGMEKSFLPEKLDRIGIRMTYANLDNDEIVHFDEICEKKDILSFYDELISSYKKWSDISYYGRLKRDESIEKLKFPFTPRKGQNFLMKNVYNKIMEREPLFIQAPTGTGKTIATVFPAIKALKGEDGIIFYLTAKNVTRNVAIKTFSDLTKKGYKGRTLEITSKDKICPLDKRECNPLSCERAKGHFDRVNDCIYEAVTNNLMIDREIVSAFAKKHNICPYFLSLDIASFSDEIVCDYNYVFDPNVKLQSFFSGGENNHIFLIDECHNLLDRAREMYSETLIKEEFLLVKKEIKDIYKPLIKPLEKVNRFLLSYKKQCDNYLYLDEIDDLIFSLLNLVSAFLRMFDKRPDIRLSENSLLFYFKIRNFLDHTDYLSKDYYRIYCDFKENGDFCLNLFCVDPSYRINECIKNGRSAVFFSATLLPIRYYKKLLLNKECDAVYINSVFNKENRLLISGVDVTTRYKMRNEDTYKKYALYIKRIVSARKGCYMAFFPSYSFLFSVYSYLKDDPDLKMIIQNRDMTEDERKDFLSNFYEGNEILGLSVLGGVFSEGIDLTGECLIGSIIIGTGIPQVSNSLSVLKTFFDEKGENGFLYAYLYPGMNKVLQAAGRVIRTTYDKGVIALLDERFLDRDIKACFPREWDDIRYLNIDEAESFALNFWKN